MHLMCVAWACGFDNTEELQNLYDSISADVNGRFAAAGGKDQGKKKEQTWEWNIVYKLFHYVFSF